MPKLYAHVFGKGEGCSKCTMLKRRLAGLIENEYKDVEMVFHDVLTEEGLMDFLKAEVLNPNRIPALLMSVEGRKGYIGCVPEEPYVFTNGATPGRVGLQTDYDNGGGLITPDMVRGVLDKARRMA